MYRGWNKRYYNCSKQSLCFMILNKNAYPTALNQHRRWDCTVCYLLRSENQFAPSRVVRTALRCYRQNEVASYVYALTIGSFAPPPPLHCIATGQSIVYVLYVCTDDWGPCSLLCKLDSPPPPAPLLLYTKSLNQVLVEGWQSLLAVCLFCVDIFTLYGQTGSKLSNIRAEQSVCTNLDENAVTRSVLLGSKNIREGRSLNIELKCQYTIVQKLTVGTEHHQLFL